MSGALAATGSAPSDTDLVAAVRAGDDHAFEELYRRYQRRIAGFVRRVVRDDARAEDVTQEAFMSALRRIRATDSEIIFKPWIYEIARNAAIDSWRRTSRAEEVSIDQDELLRPGDRSRLVGAGAPEASLFDKERIDHLRRAMDELSQTHHRILVMRELEGLSYREIGERLALTRPAVESTLFRARRRLEHEYEEIEAGRRCEAIEHAMARIAEGVDSETDMRRLSRHARGCALCRRRARQMGIEPLRSRRAAARAAAILPLPAFLRRRLSDSPGTSSSGADGGMLATLAGSGAPLGPAVAERAAALVAAVAIAGAGGAVLGGAGPAPDAWSTGGDNRGDVAKPQPTPTQSERRLQPRSGANEAAPAPSRRPGDTARQGNGERRKPGDSTPPAASPPDGGPGAPPEAGGVKTPAAPSVPEAPGLQVSSPAAPELPRAPAVEPPSASLAVPSAAGKAPGVSTDPLRHAGPGL